MATKRLEKPRRKLLQEASNENTDPARLLELVRKKDVDVQRAAWRNPSLPEEAWREALLMGHPEPWANPMAPLYVLAWIPFKEEPLSLGDMAKRATRALWKDPVRCSPEGKVLISAKIQEWWCTRWDAISLMTYLGWWVDSKGNDSPEHREAVRILLLCVRTAPDLPAEDRHALDLLEAWSQGGEDRRHEAKSLASSQVVKDTTRFSLDSSEVLWETTLVLIRFVKHREGVASMVKYNRLLADLIRQEMPLPPVVA